MACEDDCACIIPLPGPASLIPGPEGPDGPAAVTILPFEDFPVEGDADHLYIDQTTNTPYYWDTDSYVPLGVVSVAGKTGVVVLDLSDIPDLVDELAARASFKELARVPETIINGAIVVDGFDATISASVTWPGGSAGTYTALVVSTDFPGAVDSYEITHDDSGLTYTQPTVTRNINGKVTNLPDIVVA